jgi:hypothetical protein
MAVKTVEDNLMEDMMDEVGRQIAKEIDEGIMSTMLVQTGWTPVQFYFKNGEQAVDIQFWLNDTCKGKYRRLGSEYLFEHKQEAEWFILRWA